MSKQLLTQVQNNCDSVIQQYFQPSIHRGEHREFKLASERALDTLSICGNRARLSRGSLEAKREYQAVNNDSICLYRPQFNGVYEEITQGDMDILRAINMKYVQEQVKFQFGKVDLGILGEMSAADSITNVLLADLPQLLNSGLAIAITPEEIRKRLRQSKDRLSTTEITKSLKKLASFTVDGTYRVRSDEKIVHITGHLLEIITFEANNNSVAYCVLFTSRWGRLYLHNLNQGNIIWLDDEQYLRLSNGAKNILIPILAFPKSTFYRKTENMLQIMNIKSANNRSRALIALDKYLKELADVGFITWQKSSTYYTINRLLDPTKSRVNELKQVIYAEEELSLREASIVDLAKHYDMLARKHRNTINYFSLSTQNPKDHQNWKYFENVLDKCDQLSWDAKLYIEACFELAKRWKGKEFTYPLPHMLLSEKAQEWFPKYLQDRREKNGMSKKKVIKSQETKSLEEEVRSGIVDSIRILDRYITQRKQRNEMSERELCEYKALTIFQNWPSHSPYYLWSFGWFHDFLEESIKNSDESKRIKELTKYFSQIRSDKAIQKYIFECVEQLEREHSIPVNIDLKEYKVWA